VSRTDSRSRVIVVVRVVVRVRVRVRESAQLARSPCRCTGMSNTDRPLLDHENLDAYRVAIEFLALSVRLLEEIPKERRELRLQLERAAMSIPLNIAEGAGKPSPADRARYHGIARGSAMECAALLDVSQIMGVAQNKDVEQGKRLLSRLVAMLTKMCR
jgi:four helix bundle protein